MSLPQGIYILVDIRNLQHTNVVFCLLLSSALYQKIRGVLAEAKHLFGFKFGTDLELDNLFSCIQGVSMDR